MPRLSVRRPANGRAPRLLWLVSFAAAGLLGAPSPGRAQVTIFNGSGFDSPSYANGQLASFYQFGATGGQQSWLTTDQRQNPFLPQPPVAGVVHPAPPSPAGRRSRSSATGWSMTRASQGRISGSATSRRRRPPSTRRATAPPGFT